MARVRHQVEVAPGKWRLALTSAEAAQRYGLSEPGFRTALSRLPADKLAAVSHPIDGRKKVYEQTGLDELMLGRARRRRAIR